MIALTEELLQAVEQAEKLPLLINPKTQEQFVPGSQGTVRCHAEVDGVPETEPGQSRRRRPHPKIMKRGDVVEVDWPFSDRTGSKTRPAVVVQADFLNGLIDDTVLVQTTGTRHGIPGTEVLLDPVVETASGLSKVCYASCWNVLTLDQTLILQTVGILSDAVMGKIEACLKTVLDIP